MRDRILILGVILSSLVLVAIVALHFLAPRVNHTTNSLSITKDFNLTIVSRSITQSYIAFFPESEMGPYLGYMIALDGSPRNPTVTGFGPTAGIYYRMIRSPDGNSFWTLLIDLRYFAFLAAILPTIAIARRWRKMRADAVQSTASS